jgi:hypothetical protein
MGLTFLYRKGVIMGAAGGTVNPGPDGLARVEKVAWCERGG